MGVDVQQQDTAATLPPALFRRWLHSREEDSDGVEVYRTEDFPFPPSFGRDGFEMRSDGRFVQEDIGPGDGTVKVLGHWTRLASRRIGVRFTDTTDPRPGFAFDILDVDETVLRIHRLTRHPEPVVPETAQ